MYFYNKIVFYIKKLNNSLYLLFNSVDHYVCNINILNLCSAFNVILVDKMIKIIKNQAKNTSFSLNLDKI